VAWDDSILCELMHPAITALRRDIAATGAAGARQLIALADGARIADLAESPPVLTVRGSTGPPGGVLAPALPHVLADG
jgi:DNA-binding LacI/PurR family transcriptional regulator